VDILDPKAFERGIEEVRARSHNLPPEMFKDAVGQYVSDVFDAATEKCHRYLIGNQILDRPDVGTDGWFNAMSLGNWLMVADAVGVPYIPARYLYSAPTLAIYAALCGIPVAADQQASIDGMWDALQTLGPHEMLRFDMCAAGSVKAGLSDGQGIQSGWHEADGFKCPDVDGRIVHALLNYTFESLPIFARPMVPLRMVEGDVADAPAGRWPREWRVFVQAGKVCAVSNYYLQAPAAHSEAVRAREAVALATRIVGRLAEAKSWPHHPRYEGVFPTETVTCSLDFAETEDGGLLLIEGGPGHILSPPWGAHPCCFTPGAPLEGIALALGSPTVAL